MLEGLVAWVLNNYLGKYVENLNTDQLSVALLSGKVELENLPLKKDALRHLGLPVEIKAGFIGKVQLHVPVRQIRSAPWLIAIERLYVVAAPVNLDEWDSGLEALIAHDRKISLLDALEAQWRAEHEANDSGYYATSYSSWLSYGTGLLANIAENLQLTLNDVHIRYEDAVTCPDAFACGLTVESLAAESCDSSWRRAVTPLSADSDGCSFKLLQLQKLAVYWDRMPVPGDMFANCTVQELTERMSQTWRASHAYVLSPASATARVRRERTAQPLRSRQRPRLTAHLALDSVQLELTSRQYGEAVGCARGLERIGRLRELRALRPPTPVCGHARAWWIYALRAHCPRHRWMDPKPTWESCLERARTTRIYFETYLSTLTNPAATLPPNKKTAKDDFEWNTPMHILKPLRELAMHKIPKVTPAATPDKPSSGRSMLVQWFPQWWGWYGSPAEGESQSPLEGEAAPPAPPDLEEEILDVIADSLENDTLLKRDSVFGKFEFILNKGSLNLSSDGADVVRHGAGVGLELQFSSVSAGVEWRARAGAHACSVALGALTLRDRVTRDSLFPVLVAPQGMIREGLSSMNAAAACMARTRTPAPPDEPLFQLAYEKRPVGANCDRRLWVKSGSVEVVASSAAARWAHAWLFAPWGGTGDGVAAAGAAVRDHTRATLNAHLHHIMHPDPGTERRSWQVELDIYAPQILFAEDPCERDASLLVVDFGRLRLTNAPPAPHVAPPETPEPPADEEDDEDAFMTPCSTPPGSLLSPESPPDAPAPRATQLDAASLHTHIYDRYKIELSDMQVLVGRARDNWKYAHTKSSSTLHLLDRFTISLQAERRVVHTLDPQYPTATLCGTLPALVVHLSEQKLASLRAVLAATGPFRFREHRQRPEQHTRDDGTGDGSESDPSDPSANRDASLLMLQFAIDQMSLEVQSRGRSIAEVQVCGVKAALSARPGDLSLSLSVHSLLLVDALQTYGPDFELLVASHKHVGMDTASGSIRDSEPTSPTSPTSPASPNAHGPPPPHALHRALDALHSQNLNRLRDTTSPERPSPTPNRTTGADPGSQGGGCWGAPGLVDSEALIALELCLLKGEGDSEDLRIANILFNNLDIIANQETIVELIGFAQRVMSAKSTLKRPPSETRLPERAVNCDAEPQSPTASQKEVRTEITFDFHRLGVLLLRAALHDGALVAKKIATATVSEAKIQATVASCSVKVDGSLGGVQVLSLCEGAGVHTRILSAGCAAHEEKALHFCVTREPVASGTDVSAEVGVHVSVARVWYTHSGALLRDLRSCLTEFKQYLANLARSIRAAAADMAIGLVHPRGELLSQSSEGWSRDERVVLLSVGVSVESPVVVVPRAPEATQALVAHLGRLTLTHRPAPPTRALYRLRLADISLATLDVADALASGSSGASMEQIYDVSRGKPVLHDTALQLTINYCDDEHASHQYEVSGKVLGGLHVTASREQYEQLLETLQWLSDGSAPADRPPAPSSASSSAAASSSVQAEAGVPTLQLDPQLRAAVLAVPPPVRSFVREPRDDRPLTVKVIFELEDFTVELRADLGAGERSLVQLTFREFSLRYHRLHRHETTLQVSLHSVTMEDLTQEPDSKHRMLMVSHAPQIPPKAVFLSKSCPQLAIEHLADFHSLRRTKCNFGSLPTGLHLLEMRHKKRDSKCGATPPCSPENGPGDSSAAETVTEERAADNLVWVSVHTRDSQHPDFADKFNKVSKLTKVDFNSLNLVVNVDSWVTVLDFFGFAGEDDAEDVHPESKEIEREEGAGRGASAEGTANAERTQTEMSVRSLSVVVVGGRGEACRALMSRLVVVSSAEARAGTRSVEGRVGALLLADLTAHAPLWRHRLRTLGDRALSFRYRRLSCADAAVAGHDASLAVETGPVRYVHTKRFVQELQAFARDFGLLRRVIRQARRKVSAGADSSRPTRLHMRIRCASPVIVVPVSGHSRGALLAELSQLDVDNRFRRAGAADTVSSLSDPSAAAEMLDARRVRLTGLTVWCARGLRRRGPALLSSPAHLEFNVEHNIEQTHNVPDMTIQGTLTTLECALDPEQYRLVRGVLAHNLGECLDDLLPSAPPHPERDVRQQVWKTSSLKLDLQDVKVKLEPEHGVSSLACINFIKSRLLVETYSDLTQDIDLVSQEILVSDTRFAGEPANRRGNVFTHIVQPMAEHRHSVQAEVHARKRCDSSAYTILVHNMRLMAVLDWWEAANQFIMQPPPHPADPDQRHRQDEPTGEPPPTAPSAPVPHVELKLNVTDSQLVLVEDASVWDTNAVILKSTTVITYRATDAHKPISCELNELEVFSCVLGLEEETALSIVEPAAVHVALHADRVLHVATGALNLRLSYHDMRMFASMIRSLPAQARAALSGDAVADTRAQSEAPANSVHMHAARPLPPHWLARRRLPRAPPAPPPPPPLPHSAVWPLKAIRVSADSITLCVIDDCLDSDVPLVEVSFADLNVEQDLRKAEESFEDPVLVQTPVSPPQVSGAPTPLGSRSSAAGGGRLAAVLSADYYNRTLSGWEPFVEPWRFETAWESTMTSGLTLGRLQVEVASSEVLNTNVTSSLIELWQLVRANWAADYYAPQDASSQTSGLPAQSPKGSPAGHRRRSPFVPYALRNNTGHRLWFTTLLTSSDEICERRSWSGPDDSWVCVRAGDTEPFSFGRRRGREPRLPPQRLHQLALRLDGWAPPDPVCVDRVGVFFRHLTHVKSGSVARVVLEVSLEGSARKLVTVRSALQLLNLLPHAVDVRLDQTPPAVAGQGGVRGAQVPPGGAWAAPLSAQAGPLRVRPLPAPGLSAPAPAPATVDWRVARDAHALLHCECRAPPNAVYRFCCAIVRERFPPERGPPLAGHTLRLVPSLRLENLLPLELQYRAAPAPADDASAASPAQTTGALPPSDTATFHEVNVEEGVELSVKLEGFGWSSALSVGGGGVAGGSFNARLKLRDLHGRRLYLNARVTVKKTDGIKVSISAPYWLVNRTGLPLVFRAEGAAQEAAGQFEEHEVARMVAPLLFSFAEADGGPTLSARLGTGSPGSPEWCSPFGLGPGVAVKKLEVRGAGCERSYAVGVAVRQGRGRYRHTHIATFAPRYQLHNNTSHHLQFAQKCTATTLMDPGAMATHVSAVSGCFLPWHWARWDRERLLCVRTLDAEGGSPPTPRTAWSGGFRVEAARTLHVACREPGGSYQLVRVEVVLQGATLFVVLTDAECAPPPVRIHNYSPVSIMFHQMGCTEESVVGAHGSVRWAPPEPEGAAAVALRAPGGPRSTIQLDALGTTHLLAYQNFIYIVFTATLDREHNLIGKQSTSSVASDEGALVLEVPLGSTKVVLGRKRYGDRCQLWRQGPNDQLIHEGSSPPQPTDALLSEDGQLCSHTMVLDIEGPAPRPGRASALVLRRADPRRASTQAWRLVGTRMACAHANLCVQAELTAGAQAFLALAQASLAQAQAVSWRSLRPGSGRLQVALTADGPTRLLRITDHAAPESGWIEGCEGELEEEEEEAKRPPRREWGLRMSLCGLSVSLVARSPPAELVHALFAGLLLELAVGPRAVQLALSVKDMQWDNQLPDTPSPVLLQCLPERGGAALPALHAALELARTPARRYNAHFFRHLIVAVRPLAVRLEERLILKVWAWASPADEEAAREAPDESEYEARRVLDEVTALHATRYYFALMKIIPSQIRLSMQTRSKLEPELAALQRRLGLTLIKFEDAAVELEPFVRTHAFETAGFLARQLLGHFKDELKWQAAKILGSVDFLGNPLGFVADVSEGFSGLLYEGNVTALLKNVTHGLSNSAAKVTGSLGDGLERVVPDEAHEETRRRIRSSAAGAHLAAGFRGLGLGILGGMTSLVKHSYEGAAAEGLPGLIAGVGKGLVGTVTKPVIGVLDLAAETASALRESSRRGRAGLTRVRGPRCAAGAGGLLPRYCEAQAAGAALLYELNGHDYSEAFLAYRAVRGPPHDIRALLSSTHLRIFSCKSGAPQLVMEAGLGALASCAAVADGDKHLVELGVRGGVSDAVRRPRVQCDDAEGAAWLARTAAYARQLHYEHEHTLLAHPDL